jgi:hypothetical protein
VTGSFVNDLYIGSKQRKPEVGDGFTICYWSDRSAATIVEVSASGKEIKVRGDDAKRVDDRGMSDSQEYVYATRLTGPTQTFTLRKNGRWVRKGEPMRGGTGGIVGVRDQHYDFSF